MVENVTYGNDVWVPNLSKKRQDPALVSLGNAIRRLRHERAMSQDALALLTELDRSFVRRVERGDNNVAILTLLKIATALQVSVRDLIGEAGL